MKTLLHIPRDADLLEEYLCESREDAQRAARQWAQDMADDKQESVGYYYEVITLSKDVDSPEEIDDDEHYSVIEEHYAEANPVEPPCSKHGEQHNWVNNDDVLGYDEGVTFSQTCSLCGCTRVFDTWHDDGYGNPIDWISYICAED